MDRHSHWIASVLAGIVAGLLLFGLFFGRQTALWYTSRKVFGDDPKLAMTPQPLKDAAVNSLQGASFSCFGYRLDTPWTDIERVDNFKMATRIVFKSGQVVVFFSPAWEAINLRVLQETRGLLGTEAPASNYELVKDAMFMTPSHISPFMPKGESIRDYLLLAVKNGQALEFASAVYMVEGPGLRGFQKGDPRRDKSTRLDLFDHQDREVELWIAADKAGKITQADVNRIIQTLHPVESGK